MGQQEYKLLLVDVLRKIQAQPGSHIYIDEMDDGQIKLVVTRADGTGEGYSLNLTTGELKMDWHEHSDPELDEQKPDGE